ncbi:MAG: pyruvate kinase [Bdellovibrionales bacterium]|nr:pyruvate kinase [Bdellovibrionales bacterium]
MHGSSRRKVKIVGTLGPSSNTQPQIEALIRAGLDTARLNFSHGTHDMHRQVFASVREASKAAGKYVAVLQDLQGPKLRVGKLGPEGIVLKAGDEVLLYPEGTTPKSSTTGRIALPISAEIAGPLSKDVRKGSKILFDDGKIFSEVKSASPPEMVIEIQIGGKLTSNKGMNLPGTPLSLPACTDKDLKDLKLGLELGVDAVALSFVRYPKDVTFVKEQIRKTSNHKPLIVSKIEREEAVYTPEGILEVSDGFMIARGDMAVELGAEKVPKIQKMLIRMCNELGVPVITATQMLESMISSPTPTRAEASDVANAVFDGTDAVMLSAESASGQYPINAVITMSQIIMEAETATDRYSVHQPLTPISGSVVESIEYSASKIAGHVGARAIACLTHSGMAARTLAKYRPEIPIVAIMDSEASLRKLAFVWGIEGVLIPELVSTDDLFGMVSKVLVDNNRADEDDIVVVTAGTPTLGRGTTNTIKVHQVKVPVSRS